MHDPSICHREAAVQCLHEFLVRGKPGKKPPLSGCIRSGIISGASFFFHVPSGLLSQAPVPPGAPEPSHCVLGQSVPTKLPPSLHALCLGLGNLLLLNPQKSFAQCPTELLHSKCLEGWI